MVRIGGSVFVVTAGLGPFGEVAPGLFGGAALERARFHHYAASVVSEWVACWALTEMAVDDLDSHCTKP